MDTQFATLSQALLVMAAFAAMHERVIEILRAIGQQLKVPWIDVFTSKHLNVVPALALALATQADLIALFHKIGNRSFFDLYLTDYSTWHDLGRRDAVQHLVGCVLMGFSTTLGAKFMHDLAGSLTDLRSQMKAVGQPKV